MKRLLFLGAILLFPFSIEGSQTGWTSVKSANFFLAGNAPERDIQQVARNLELFHAIFSKFVAGGEPRAGVPTRVIVFRSASDYGPLRPVHDGRQVTVSGLFHPGRTFNYVTLTIQDGGHPYGALYHEYVHLFIASNLKGLPLCFNEGLAEYYSTFETSGSGEKFTLGQAPAVHIETLKRQELLPLGSLFEVDETSAYYNDKRKRRLFYAQSWALVHYLMQSNDALLSQFSEFLNLLAGDNSFETAFTRAFGRDYAQFEKEFRSYIQRGNYQTVVHKAETGFEIGELATAPITEAEANYYLGDLLLQLEKTEDAELYLMRALALDPKNARARASLGALRVKQKRLSEGLELLRKSLDSDPSDYLLNYLYAFALSREGMTDDSWVQGYRPESVIKMYRLLKKAIQLEPEFVESYRLLAFVHFATGSELEAAQRLIERAIQLAPGRQDLLVLLAQIRFRQNDVRSAREILEIVVRTEPLPNSRQRAREILEMVKAADSNPKPVSRPGENGGGEISVESDAPAYHRPRLTKRFKGDRIKGFLTNIDCSEKEVFLYVKTELGIFRLRADELKKVLFVTYVTGLERSIECGQRKRANLAVVTYRPVPGPRGNFDGEAVAVEFVPDDIEFDQ